MGDETITRERVKELLRFLRRFERPGRKYVKAWAGGKETAEGALTVPHPVYEDDVLAFFRLAGQPWWSDFSYEPREAYLMLQDDEFIGRCSLDDIRTMLTYCVRGERFCDGHWQNVLRSGRVVALLRRLAALEEKLA
jgi:hypothetical protein